MKASKDKRNLVKYIEQSYSQYCKKQFASLNSDDHALFRSILKGLCVIGYNDEGGNDSTLHYLSRGSSGIKIFRQAETPEIIRICYSN